MQILCDVENQKENKALQPARKTVIAARPKMRKIEAERDHLKSTCGFICL